jgi:hypothetical protein
MKNVEKSNLQPRTKNFGHGLAKKLGASAVGAAFLVSPVASTAPPHEQKVTICHKGKAISVSRNALNAHLAHGDTVGPCVVTPTQNR